MSLTEAKRECLWIDENGNKTLIGLECKPEEAVGYKDDAEENLPETGKR